LSALHKESNINLTSTDLSKTATQMSMNMNFLDVLIVGANAVTRDQT